MIIRVRTLPPKPWPFTVGGLPLWLTTDEFADCFDRGRTGKGRKALEHIDLQRKEEFSEDILRKVITVFRDLQVKIRDIMWCPGFWRITIPDNTDLKVLPSFVAHQVCFYKFQSDDPDPDPSALRAKVPQGVEYDDTLYATTPNALLRPGIMVSSSIRIVKTDGKTEERFKITSSGILVVDRHGQLFITVATHGFEDDGLVYHPTPVKGSVIGRIVDRLPGTDISIVKLNSGLRYVNETFGTTDNPSGITASGISPCYPPHLRAYDPITMDNPFSGSCQGFVLGLGGKIPEEGDKDYVLHEWQIFENGNEPVDGSCGSPILNSDGEVVGLFHSRRKIPSIVWGYLRWSYARSDMKFAPESNSFEQLPHALWILLSDIARSTLVPNLPHGRCVRQRLRSATSHRANSGFHDDFRWIWLSLRLQERKC